MSFANRRNVLAGLTMGAGGLLAHVAMSAEPSRMPGIGGTDPGPRDPGRDQQNPDLSNPPSTDHGTLPNLRFSFTDSHVRQESGGWTRQITERELGESKGIAGVNMRLNAGGLRELHRHKRAEWACMVYGTARMMGAAPVPESFSHKILPQEPGGFRELHWHPNADEWQYFIEFQGRMSVFATSGQERNFDFRAGNVGDVHFAMSHNVENTGGTPLCFLKMFKSSYYDAVSLNQWLALTSQDLLKAHRSPDQQLTQMLRKQKAPILPV